MSAIREPYWSDEHAAIYHGDAREVLAERPAGSVDCIITSPPYWGLRHYCEGQYGQEPTPETYVENLRATFAEARRVLADDGTCWLNLGDVYAANSDGWARGAAFNPRQPSARPKARLALPPKNLLGDRHRDKIEQYEAFCDELGEDPANVGLAWLLHQKVVTAPIIGPRTLDQLDGTTRALEIKLDEKALARLDEIFPGFKTAPEEYAW
ncbi:aldo/keto reductase [Streptosporangium canum]|uniref:aldo/keto reductase n=1 Tax=Streptosporangium canum TaxID=324952 RepID=UPI003422D470